MANSRDHGILPRLGPQCGSILNQPHSTVSVRALCKTGGNGESAARLCGVYRIFHRNRVKPLAPCCPSCYSEQVTASRSGGRG
jgi:hypothetical protein